MADYKDEWLERIENTLNQIRDQTSEIKPIRERLDAHIAEDNRLFHGNGSPGLIKDVDRLKQLKRNLAWLIGVILLGAGSSVAEIARAVMSVLK